MRGSLALETPFAHICWQRLMGRLLLGRRYAVEPGPCGELAGAGCVVWSPHDRNAPPLQHRSTAGAIQVLEQVVGGQLEVLVPPLRRTVDTGD
jgi:hypothetical protein